jgi:hypothetical protein
MLFDAHCTRKFRMLSAASVLSLALGARDASRTETKPALKYQ